MQYKFLSVLLFVSLFYRINPLFRPEPTETNIEAMTFFPLYFHSFFAWYNLQTPMYDNSDAEFMMRNFKVKPCPNRIPHDWTDCRYTHQGERTKRRDPYEFPYSKQMCWKFRAYGNCDQGDNCRFSHGISEFWFHPARYRTRMCNMGHACRRTVCFFAHNALQKRQPFNIFPNHINACADQAVINPTVDLWGEYFWWSFFNSVMNEEASNELESVSDHGNMVDINKLIMEKFPHGYIMRDFFEYINHRKGPA